MLASEATTRVCTTPGTAWKTRARSRIRAKTFGCPLRLFYKSLGLHAPLFLLGRQAIPQSLGGGIGGGRVDDRRQKLQAFAAPGVHRAPHVIGAADRVVFV